MERAEQTCHERSQHKREKCRQAQNGDGRDDEEHAQCDDGHWAEREGKRQNQHEKTGKRDEGGAERKSEPRELQQRRAKEATLETGEKDGSKEQEEIRNFAAK